MTALPSWPPLPKGHRPAREISVGDFIIINGREAEVITAELRHYYDGPSIIVPTDARIIIEALDVASNKTTLELGLLDPIEVLPD